MFDAEVIGCSSYLPDKVLTNLDLSSIVDTSHEWISERTGISERRIASDSETVVHMSARALSLLIAKTGINASDIDLLIVATVTQETSFPSTACLIQNKLALQNVTAFDMQAACSGFVYSVSIASKFIQSGSHKLAVVIGVDKMSAILDWSDRSTCVLFGDGAGAVLIQAKEKTNLHQSGSGIIDSILYSDGLLSDILHTSGKISANTGAGYITMNGKEVFRNAVMKMTDIVEEILQKNNFTINDIDAIVPHQANSRITSAVAKRLGVSEEKIVLTVGKHANTSAASIPLALDTALSSGKIKKGDLVILEAVGAGMTWGAVLVRM